MHIVPKHLKDSCLDWFRLMLETWVVDKSFPQPDAQAANLMAAIEDTWRDEVGLIRAEIEGCEDNNVDPLTGGDLSRWRLQPRGV